MNKSRLLATMSVTLMVGADALLVYRGDTTSGWWTIAGAALVGAFISFAGAIHHA